jgi:hypothetical protein
VRDLFIYFLCTHAINVLPLRGIIPLPPSLGNSLTRKGTWFSVILFSVRRTTEEYAHKSHNGEPVSLAHPPSCAIGTETFLHKDEAVGTCN